MTEPIRYVRACALADVPEEGALGVEVQDTPVAIIRTGKPTGPPATKPVPTYPVQTEGSDVYVSLPDQER